MKRLLFIVLMITSIQVHGQDTIVVFNNYKYKLGSKVLVSHSTDYTFTDDATFVTSGGLQIVRRFGNSKSSLESGVYMMTKAVDRQLSRILFRNLTIPINYRYDTKVFYVAGGLYADYLIGRQNAREELSSLYNDRKFNVGFNFISGVEKSINKHLTLLIEGHYFINLTSYRSAGPEGLEFGIRNIGFSIRLNYKVLR